VPILGKATPIASLILHIQGSNEVKRRINILLREFLPNICPPRGYAELCCVAI